MEELLEAVGSYRHAVLAYISEDGYPMNVPTTFRPDVDRGTIEIDRDNVPMPTPQGRSVSLIFSHVRPKPGTGYDQRRYVNVRGTIEARNGVLELKPERVHGWDEERMSFFELCERSVPVAHRYMQALSIERGRPVKTKVSRGWLIFLATRIPFLTATIVPILLGALVARSHGFSSWWLTILALVGGGAIHLGLNVLNDVHDAKSGADHANVTPTMFSGGSRMIQYGLLSVDTMTRISISLYAVGIAIGLGLVITRGIELLWIGAAGIFLSIFYTAPPLKFVHRGLGEVCVALGFGPIMVLGSYFVVAQRLSAEALYASLPVALLIMLVLYVNQIPDRRADAKAGKNTIVVRLSKEGVIAGYTVSVTAAFGLIVVGAALGVISAWTLIALVAAPLAVRVYQGMRAHYDNPYELMGAMGTNILVHFAAGMLLSLGYLLEIIA